ncbi:MAG: glycoside hydrolase family 18 protein [Spirochaetaceae bacterium]|nr:glycoside hydrolase family 18 protein [Spirochaetaceae bacterium]
MNVFTRKRNTLFRAAGAAVIAAVVFILASCASTETKAVSPVIDPDGPKIASYIRTWPLGSTTVDMDAGEYWNGDMVHGEYLTDLIIAFAHIDPKDGTSIFIKDLEDQPSVITEGKTVPGFPNFWEEIAKVKARFPHLRVNLSVGGWGADGFSDMSADPAMRAKFVANVCDWLQKYNLDGFDVDWEYPVGPPWGGSEIKVSPDDRQNYITLLSDLRSGLDTLGSKTGKRYELSTAVPASGWFIEANDVVAAAAVVDSLKLMSYDYYGAWSAQTGHHANLYNNPRDPDWGGWSTDQAVRTYLDAGVPAEKLVVGVAFYGRAWKGVAAGDDPVTPGLYQKYAESTYPDGASWGDIQTLMKDPSYTYYWDDVAKAPYLYNGDEFITFTDTRLISEIDTYVKENRLGGVMIWEYGHDVDASLLKPLAEGVQ